MDPMLIIFIIAAVILIGFIAYYSWKKEKERTASLSALAATSNMSFKRRDHSIPDRYGYLNGFNTGHSRYAYNIISGEYRGYQTKAFDFKYTTTEHYTDSNGRRRTRNVNHYFSSVLVDMGISFPRELFIRKEGMLDKLASIVGFDDIDFESDEFSRKFYVKCKDKKFAYDVIHPRMMEFLLEHGKFQIELDHSIVHFRQNKRFKVEDFHSIMDTAHNFIELFPSFLLKDLTNRNNY